MTIYAEERPEQDAGSIVPGQHGCAYLVAGDEGSRQREVLDS